MMLSQLCKLRIVEWGDNCER